MHTIYIEKEIRNHARVERILSKVGRSSQIILCDHYKEVFNPKSQNFRIQKNKPALILAKKQGRLVIPAPSGFGIGGENNFYFSYMLNCIYDCRYCFLQGMYPSANQVIFINYEDFMDAIYKLSKEHSSKTLYLFSGYDCDSLAFEGVTDFFHECLNKFKTMQNIILELRTKSTNIKSLLQQPSLDNCIIAFSFTPDVISKQVEKGVPKVSKRIETMRQLANQGWRLGLRFDPLIYATNYESLYHELITEIFLNIQPKAVHSVSVGPLRFPAKMYQKLIKLYPKDKLLAHPLLRRKSYYSYSENIETKMKKFMLTKLQNYLDKTLLFECHPL